MSAVLQDWATVLPWKQQSILISGMRGPDVPTVPNIKAVNRWMRTVSQHNADPSKDYMKQSVPPYPHMVSAELEFLPCHYVHHFADALAVIAYGHFDPSIQSRAFAYHAHIAEELFHFIPEQPDIFRWRHRDKPNNEDGQPVKPYNDRLWMQALLPTWYEHP